MQTVTENEQVGSTVNNDCSLTNVMITTKGAQLFEFN